MALKKIQIKADLTKTEEKYGVVPAMKEMIGGTFLAAVYSNVVIIAQEGKYEKYHFCLQDSSSWEMRNGLRTSL